MTEPRAIKATFADWRTVKGRKQLQLIFEVPIEQQAEVLTMLGAPMPADPLWCGIALLDLKGGDANTNNRGNPAVRENKTGAGDGKRSWGELPPAQQAGIVCNEPAFQRFLEQRHRRLFAEMAFDPPSFVRQICDIATRADLNTNAEAAARWRELDAEYRAWARL